ncbi:MAG: 23S rRNA (guanosine(2251)-2'-O)-methyltransferase RlmB [Gammaproteobacteria bacterium]|nr:23S rRNA (guanosine(2251)-2'-O)-methyltransferase RlmB [Gammaproteobacteria bacterium]
MSNNVIYGIHAIQAKLKRSPGSVQKIYVLAGKRSVRLESLVGQAKGLQIGISELSRDELDKMVQGGVHQGVVASVRAISSSVVTLDDVYEKTEKLFLLVLDGVQDPHNLGACLRVADAAGVDAVIAPKDNAVSLTPTVRKVASGAAETVPYIQVTNLARTLQELKDRGIWLYGAAGEAEDTIFDKKLERPLAIVMGAEGKGLRRLTRDHCDFLVKIPMEGSVDSLNVSVATGICCFEVVRQHLLS